MTRSHAGQPLVTEYGCTLCQRQGKPCWHRKGIDAEYEPHLMWQDKHGPRERVASPDEVLKMIRNTATRG